MLRPFTVAIPEEAAAELDALAREEFRRPKDQAAALLVDAIERASRRRAAKAGSPALPRAPAESRP